MPLPGVGVPVRALLMDERVVPTLACHEIDLIFGCCCSFIDLGISERAKEPAMAKAHTRLNTQKVQVRDVVQGTVEQFRSRR